ncbi:Ig domain-containing protein, partial [Streptococcus pyogenes]|uniref:Ig domain-containing protein n=1 Tax=Streptococcus pyogenes TaxID=1314 RepID=UPI001CA33D86
RRLAAAALALAMTLQPLAAADFQYFRMYGHTGFGDPGTGSPGSQAFSFSIVGPAAVTVGKTATFSTVVQNARGATSFDIASGALPSGVTLNSSSGAISGVTSSLGSFNAIIHGIDASGSQASAVFSLAVVNDFTIV